MFDCEVRHSYSEPVSGLSGYDCYDGGEHVDGHKGASGAPQPGQVLYLVSDERRYRLRKQYLIVRSGVKACSSVNPATALPWLLS